MEYNGEAWYCEFEVGAGMQPDHMYEVHGGEGYMPNPQMQSLSIIAQ